MKVIFTMTENNILLTSPYLKEIYQSFKVIYILFININFVMIELSETASVKISRVFQPLTKYNQLLIHFRNIYNICAVSMNQIWVLLKV